MLERDPEQRPPAAELLRHPWLAGQTRRSSAANAGPQQQQHQSSAARSMPGNVTAQLPEALAESLVQRLQRYGIYGQIRQVRVEGAAGRQAGRDPALYMLYVYGTPQSMHALMCVMMRYAAVCVAAAAHCASIAPLHPPPTWHAPTQVCLREIAALVAADAQSPGADAQLMSLVLPLQSAFVALCPPGSKTVPASSLADLLMSCGAYDLSSVEVGVLTGQLDVDGDGQLDEAEWLAALLDWRDLSHHASWSAWVAATFSALDADGDGVISRTELEGLLRGRAPAELPGEEPYVLKDAVPAALREADEDGDGTLSLAELETMLVLGDVGLELFAARLF
jgi:Ca2+-binding EF-hand superfamily protein